MSFGVGVGDVIAVGTLALRVVTEAKSAPAGFANAADDALALHTVVEKVKGQLQSKRIDEQSGVGRPLTGCKRILEELLQLLSKYKSLASADRKLTDRVRWDQNKVSDLRLQLVSHTNMLEVLIGLKHDEAIANMTDTLRELNTTSTSTAQDVRDLQAKVERALRNFQKRSSSSTLASAQTRTTSATSFYTAESVNVDERRAWQALRQDFAKEGITAEDFEKYKPAIIRYFTDAIVNGDVGEELTVMICAPGSLRRRESSATLNTLSTDATIRAPSYATSIVSLWGQEKPQPYSKESYLSLSEYRQTVEKASPAELQVISKEFFRRVSGTRNRSLSLAETLRNRRYKKLLACNTWMLWTILIARDMSISTLEPLLAKANGPNDAWLLCLASSRGSSNVIAKLLDAGLPPMCLTEGGESPLHFAAASCNIDAIKILLKAGADPNAQDSWLRTPLLLACYLALAQLVSGSRADTIEYLLRNGADVHAKNSSSETALHFILEYRILLDEQHEQMGKEVRDETTALSKDTYAAARVLLEYGIDVDQQASADGFTALHLAAANGWRHITKLLLEYGADTSLKSHTDKTPLDYARMWFHEDVARMLREHIDANKRVARSTAPVIPTEDALDLSPIWPYENSSTVQESTETIASG